MISKKEDWLLVEVSGYDIQNNKILGRNISNGLPVNVSLEDGQKKNWIGWLSDPSRAESAQQGSILALYNVKQNGNQHNHYTAGWGTTVSKDISSESIIVAPFTVSHTIKTFPNKNERYIDGIVLDNQPVFVSDVSDVRDIASSIIDNPQTPLNGQRGFMIRAVSPNDPDKGHIEAFYGRKGLTGQQIYDFHLDREAQSGFNKNRLKQNLDNVHYAVKGGSELSYEIIGFSRSLIQTYGSDKKLQSLSQMPNYRIPGIGEVLPRQAFSYAALVVDPARPNIIKHHLPLPRAKISNSLFGVLKLSEQQKKAVGVISSGGISNQFSERPTTTRNNSRPLLRLEDYVNQSGKVKSFRIRADASNISDHAARITNALPGVKPFMVENNTAYSFPIEFKKQLSSSLSDLLGTPPLYLREMHIDGASRLVIDGRVRENTYKSVIEKIKQSVPHTEDSRSNLHFDIASYDQLSGFLEKIPAAKRKPQAALQSQDLSQPATKAATTPKNDPKTHKVSFGDWLEAKFMGRYDAMVSYLHTEIANFAAREAHIDWDISADNADIGYGNSRGDLIRRSSLVRPIKGSETHSGSLSFAVNTYEKLDPKYKNPSRWFNINFVNLKIKRGSAFVFNGYEFLHDAYERDNGLVLTNSTEETLKKLEKERNERTIRAEQNAKHAKLEEEKETKEWAKKIPLMKNESGTSSIFSKKKIAHVIGHIPLKMGVDAKLGRFTTLTLHDIDNNFRGVQNLFEKSWKTSDGKWDNKLFSRNGIFKDKETDQYYGTHCIIGELKQEGPIYFGEGFSTCASVFEATGVSAVVALNAGNLPHVVSAYRRKHPERQLIIIADNDKWKPMKGNAGVMKAAKASFESQAHFVVPEFNAQDSDKTPTDANDLRILNGIDALRSQLRNIHSPITKRSNYEIFMVENCGLEALGKTIKEIIASHTELEQSPLTRSLLYSAIKQYGRQEVLEQLAPEFKEYVAFPENNTSSAPVKQHLTGPDISVLEAVSPSQKKYCLIKDNTGGKHKDIIDNALRSVVGKNTLAYNGKLAGWVAPYPTINIIKSYLFEETNSPQLYIGKSRSKNENRFVIRGNFDDPVFRDKIDNQIEFANPRYLKSEYGLVVDDISYLDNVKKQLSLYLVKPSIVKLEEAVNVDPQKIRIEALLEQARRVSGEPNSIIVQSLHQLSNGNQPSVFTDDDYVFAGLYSRCLKSIDVGDSTEKHFKALNEASNTYISLDRQGVLEGILSLEQRRSCKALAIHLKSVVRGEVHLDQTEISEIAKKHDLNLETFQSVFLGEPLKEEIKLNKSVVVASIRGSLAKQSYSASFRINNKSNVTPQDATQAERVEALLELTKLAAKEGYSLEEYQEIFLKTEGSPYHPRGGEYSPEKLQADIVHIGKNHILGSDFHTLTTEASLFEHYADAAAESRLTQYYKYIAAMVEERGHITYESFSAYLKGKRNPVVDIANPYSNEGEFNEELLSDDVARLTMYKNHQALYQEYGSSILKSNDIFSENDNTVKPEINSGPGYDSGKETSITVDEDILPCINFNGDAQGLSRLRCQIRNDEGESLAIDEWFQSIDTIPNYIRSIKNGDSPEGSLVETDVLQHINRDGATFAVSRLLTEPERYFISGGHPKVDDNTNKIFTDKHEAQRVFAEGKTELLKIVTPSATEMDKPAEDLPSFIKQCVKKGLSIDDFTAKLAQHYKVEINPDLKQAIEKQYRLLIDSRPEADLISTDDSRFEKLQDTVTKLILQGLDYDDIYEELLSNDGALGINNPYIDEHNSLDRKAFVSDIKAAGYSSLRKLYESRYAAINGNQVQGDMLPRANTLLPSTIIENASLKAQLQLLVDTVQNYQMIDVAFDRNNFPTFREWQSNTASYIPIHPILAIDLKGNSAPEELASHDKNALRLLADIHGVHILKENGAALSDDIIAQWKTRTQLSDLTSDELRYLSQDERNDIAVGLGMPELHKNISASAIKNYVSQIDKLSEQRNKEYSYIVAALAYEEKHGKLPNYATRVIAEKIDSKGYEFESSEPNQLRKHYSRCEADAAISVLSSVSSIQRNSFSADSIKQVEVVSQTGKDYIGSYKNFYAPTASSVQLPREVSHYGKYENSIYGLPYALTAEECERAKLSPLSAYAVKKVSSSLDAWISEHGAVGMIVPETGSLFVLGRNNDRTFLVEHHGSKFESTKCGELHDLICHTPTDLLSFTDRNEICEKVAKKLSTTHQISYAEVECRMFNRAPDTLIDSIKKLREDATTNQWINDIGDEEPSVVIHALARKMAEHNIRNVLSGYPYDDTHAKALISALPEPSPLPVDAVINMSNESKALFFDKKMAIEGLNTNSSEYEKLRKQVLDRETNTTCAVTNYISLIEKSSPNLILEVDKELTVDEGQPVSKTLEGVSHAFVKRGENTMFCGAKTVEDQNSLTLSSPEIERAIGALQNLPKDKVNLVVDPNSNTLIKSGDSTAELKSLERHIRQFNAFELKSLAETLSVPVYSSRAEAIENIKFHVLNKPSKSQAQKAITELLESKRNGILEQCNAKYLGGSVNWEAKTLTLEKQSTTIVEDLISKSYPLSDYTSLSQIANKLTHGEDSEKTKAFTSLYFGNVSPQAVEKANQLMPSMCDLVSISAPTGSAWQLKTPSGIDTTVFSSLGTAIVSSESTLHTIAEEIPRIATKSSVLVHHQGRLVSGQIDEAQQSTGAESVKVSVQKGDQTAELNLPPEHIIYSSQEDLESAYKRKLTTFKGSFDDFSNILHREYESSGPDSRPSSKYYYERSKAEGEMAKTIESQASHVTIHRSGAGYQLIEKSSKETPATSIYTSLEAISAYLVAKVRESVQEIQETQERIAKPDTSQSTSVSPIQQ